MVPPKGFLKTFNPVAKFLAVKTVVFFTYWQFLCVGLTPDLTADEVTWYKHGRYESIQRVKAPFPQTKLIIISSIFNFRA